MENKLLALFDTYPFLTLLTSGDFEYVCVIQSHDDLTTTFYDFGAVKSEEHRRIFLDLCDQWWWESNRIIPINLFLKSDWDFLKYTQKTVSSKTITILAGAEPFNLSYMKKSKRKSVTVLKRL